MGDRNIIGKDILKQFTVGFANILSRLNIDPDQLELLDTSKQRVEERHADFLPAYVAATVANAIIAAASRTSDFRVRANSFLARREKAVGPLPTTTSNTVRDERARAIILTFG